MRKAGADGSRDASQWGPGSMRVRRGWEAIGKARRVHWRKKRKKRWRVVHDNGNVTAGGDDVGYDDGADCCLYWGDTAARTCNTIQL
jgi:hypothetical protein